MSFLEYKIQNKRFDKKVSFQFNPFATTHFVFKKYNIICTDYSQKLIG